MNWSQLDQIQKTKNTDDPFENKGESIRNSRKNNKTIFDLRFIVVEKENLCEIDKFTQNNQKW